MTRLFDRTFGTDPFQNTRLQIDLCHFRERLRPTTTATGHQRGLWIPLPFGKTLWICAYSWRFESVETEPLITGPIECARCGEEFDGLTARTMHVIRKRCPEIDTDADVDAVDTLHAMEEPFR